MFFSNTHWAQLMVPFYSILFETSICQNNSSEFSPIMPDEVREHLTRDQRPFIITPDPSDSQLPDGASSLQFTPLLSEDWDGHGRSFILCSVTHFCVDFDIYICFGLLS